MTIASSRGTELDIDTIAQTGMRLSGVLDSGQTADDDDLSLARILIDTIADELETEGVFARSVEFVEVTMDPNQTNPGFYDLSSSVLNVVGDAMYIPAGEDTSAATGETVVRQMQREEWHERSSKAADGTPTQFYLHRAAIPLQIRVWPRPDEAGTIRLQAQRLKADSTTGSNTLDVRQHWTQFFIWELAHQFAVAKSIDIQRCSYLNKRAQEKRDKCRAFSNQTVDTQMIYDSPNRWEGR